MMHQYCHAHVLLHMSNTHSVFQNKGTFYNHSLVYFFFCSPSNDLYFSCFQNRSLTVESTLMKAKETEAIRVAEFIAFHYF